MYTIPHVHVWISGSQVNTRMNTNNHSHVGGETYHVCGDLGLLDDEPRLLDAWPRGFQEKISPNEIRSSPKCYSW
jgi:hypothetical protein